MVWGLQSSHFPTKIQSKNQAFSETPSRTSFFRFLKRLVPKMLDFWIPPAPSWIPNCTPNHPRDAKMASRTLSHAHPWAVLEPACLQDLPRSAAEHYFGWFWKDFGWFSTDVLICWYTTFGLICWTYFWTYFHDTFGFIFGLIFGRLFNKKRNT